MRRGRGGDGVVKRGGTPCNASLTTENVHVHQRETNTGDLIDSGRVGEDRLLKMFVDLRRIVDERLQWKEKIEEISVTRIFRHAPVLVD